jgi:hypothetical protein
MTTGKTIFKTTSASIQNDDPLVLRPVCQRKYGDTAFYGKIKNWWVMGMPRNKHWSQPP